VSAAKGRHIVVTGGAGFIGSHTVAHLVAQGDEVLVIDDLRHACEQPLPPSVELHAVEVSSPEAAQRIVAFKPDAILHLAAQGGVSRSIRDPAGDAQINVVGTVALLKAATDALETHGAEVVVAPGEHQPARVGSALDQLGDAGVTSILLEGGPRLAGAFLNAGEIDEIRLFLAPLLLGERTARVPIEGEGVDLIADAVRALTLDCESVGEDLLVSARMKEW